MAPKEITIDVEVTTKMTAKERGHLRTQEGKIATAQEHFLRAGAALRTIRDEMLFRETHKSFSDYLKDRWGFDRSHAYRLMESAEIHERVKGVIEVCPEAEQVTKEGQLRELKSIESTDLGDVIKQAAEIAAEEGKPIQAKHLHESAALHLSDAADEETTENPGTAAASETGDKAADLAIRDCPKLTAKLRLRLGTLQLDFHDELDRIEAAVNNWGLEPDDLDPGDMDGDHESALASAGMGVDESYIPAEF